MTVSVYNSTDSGAPTLTGQAGSLITLLNACLVNGYGSKSAAGFTSPYTGTNTAVYKAGSGNAFPLLVSDNVSSVAQFNAYESMSSISDGVNPFPNEAQVGGGGGVFLFKSSTTDSTARPWLLVTNGNLFHLWVGYNLTTGGGMHSSAASQPMFTYGDFVSYKSGDAYNTCIIGAGSNAAISTDWHGAGTTSSGLVPQVGHFIVRSSEQVGASITSGKFVDICKSNFLAASGTSTAAYPDPIFGGLMLGAFELYDNVSSMAIPRGYLPGLYFLYNYPSSGFYCGDTFEGTGAYSSKTFMLLDVPAGASYAHVAIEISSTW